jgi:hypothetical protein
MLISPPRRPLRFGALPSVWRCLHFLLILRLCFSGDARAQLPVGSAIGSLQTIGEVYLDGKPAAEEQTVFGGENVRTGSNGVAALSVPGSGIFNVAGQTEISLPTSRSAVSLVSVVSLIRGTVAARSFQSGKSLEIEFGDFAVHLPVGEAAAAAALTVSRDGAAKVECLDGIIAVSRLQGTESVNLRVGQSVTIDTRGRMQDVKTAQLSPIVLLGEAPPSQQPSSKRSRTPYILLGTAAAAGGIGAAAIGLSHKSSQPTSPSAP